MLGRCRRLTQEPDLAARGARQPAEPWALGCRQAGPWAAAGRVRQAAARLVACRQGHAVSHCHNHSSRKGRVPALAGARAQAPGVYDVGHLAVHLVVGADGHPARVPVRAVHIGVPRGARRLHSRLASQQSCMSLQCCCWDGAAVHAVQTCVAALPCRLGLRAKSWPGQLPLMRSTCMCADAAAALAPGPAPA